MMLLNPDGTVLRQWGSKGTGNGQFTEPWGIAVAADGSVYVADTWNHRIQKFTNDGRLDGTISDPGYSVANKTVTFSGGLSGTTTTDKGGPLARPGCHDWPP